MDRILGVEDLAKALGMSRSHLSRRLLEEAGLCPTAFLREERLKRAKHLLRNTQLAVKEIAATVGISSEQQLCRLIRQECGTTTREYRAAAM
jgi:transcriptional regulator GlxA family with amidase domain